MTIKECVNCPKATDHSTAGVPDGWRLVPEKLTEEMALAGYAEVPPRVLLHSAWKAMLSAAPAQPAAQDKTSIETALAIKVEKLLCEKLGIEWAPAGMSVESLVDRLAAAQDQGEVQRLREALETVEHEHELLRQMKNCEIRRPRGSFGIAVMSDPLAIEWQALDSELQQLIDARRAVLAASTSHQQQERSDE